MEINKRLKHSGIYCIINKINGKKYIGSSKNIYSRWLKHRAYLRGGYHTNSHLQNAWNKYGEESFHFFVICKCSEEDLLVKEQFYIDNMNPEYNIMLEAKRTKVSDVIREHISQGVRRAIAEGRKTLNPMIGKKMTDEHKAKMPQYQKGYKCPARQKGVVLYDSDGKFFREFSTLEDAALFIGVTVKAVRYAIVKSKTHKCKNYYVSREKKNNINE